MNTTDRAASVTYKQFSVTRGNVRERTLLNCVFFSLVQCTTPMYDKINVKQTGGGISGGGA